jgi:WD40 repeat protein
LLHNAADGSVKAYPEQPSTIADVQGQPDSSFFTVAAYRKLSTFSATSTEAVKEFAWKGSILKVAWSSDGNYVVTGNQDATVHFWYRKTGRDLEMSGYPAKIRDYHGIRAAASWQLAAVPS